MAKIVATVCDELRAAEGTNAVALSGGTFQNMLLLTQTTDLLEQKQFVVHTHQRVPTNDGGLALGQAILADSVFRRSSRQAELLPG
jgi:hydrogenase maturation protein HypF